MNKIIKKLVIPMIIFMTVKASPDVMQPTVLGLPLESRGGGADVYRRDTDYDDGRGLGFGHNSPQAVPILPRTVDPDESWPFLVASSDEEMVGPMRDDFDPDKQSSWAGKMVYRLPSEGGDTQGNKRPIDYNYLDGFRSLCSLIACGFVTCVGFPFGTKAAFVGGAVAGIAPCLPNDDRCYVCYKASLRVPKQIIPSLSPEHNLVEYILEAQREIEKAEAKLCHKIREFLPDYHPDGEKYRNKGNPGDSYGIKTMEELQGMNTDELWAQISCLDNRRAVIIVEEQRLAILTRTLGPQDLRHAAAGPHTANQPVADAPTQQSMPPLPGSVVGSVESPS